MDKQMLLRRVRTLIPSLTAKKHKGQAGRVAVIGGCELYTGAPYFSSLSALRSGSDLCFIMCTKEASIPIKSYNPELMVQPFLKESSISKEEDVEAMEKDFGKISEWISRLSGLVVGPGLGRDALIFKYASHIISSANEKKIPIVIDADGLYLITENPLLIKNCTNITLTPNVVEFQRLTRKILGEDAVPLDQLEKSKSQILQLCEKLGFVSIVRKGEYDLICNGKTVVICDEQGSYRRVGGQGDILSGTMATFLDWAQHKDHKTEDLSELKLAGMYWACALTRRSSRLAFAKHKRSMGTVHVLECVPEAFQQLFPFDCEDIIV